MGYRVSATAAMGEESNLYSPPTPLTHTPHLKLFVLEINRLERIVSGSSGEHFGMEKGEAFQIPQAPGVGWGWGRASMNTLAPFSSAMSHILM